MEVRPLVLRRELVSCFQDIEMQIDELKQQAQQMGIRPSQLRTTDGSWAMAPLLAAKSQILHSLTLLNIKGRSDGA